MDNTVEDVVAALEARGLSPSVTKSDISGDCLESSPYVVSVGDQTYVCACLGGPNMEKAMEDMAGDDVVQRRACNKIEQTVRYLTQARRYDEKLSPTILLDFADMPNISTRSTRHVRHLLESSLTAFTLVREPGEEEFLGRVPGLFTMPIVHVPDLPWGWTERLDVGGGNGVPAIGVHFPDGGSPGLAVLSGGNNSGKSRFSSMLMDALSCASFPSLRPFQPYDEARMRPYRRALGYGLPDGSLLMPLAYEGSGTQRLERVVSAIARSADWETGWPGIVLDTPLSGISDLLRIKLCEVIARLSVNRQVIVTVRDKGDARILTMLAHAHGAPAGTAHLDFSGMDTIVQVKPAPSLVPDVISVPHL